jgi:hypothetical protein
VNVINLKRIWILILILSLTANVLLISQVRDKTANIQADDYGYVNYLLTRKMDTESYVLHSISQYFILINKEERSVNDLRHYLNGVGEFLKGDFLRGVDNTILEERNDIREVQRDIIITIIDTEKFLDNSYSVHYKELSVLYEELADLLNRNNKEKSLSYFISIEDYDNEKIKDVLGEIKNVISEIRKYQ